MPRRLALILASLVTASSSSAATLRARLAPPRHGLQVRLGSIPPVPNCFGNGNGLVCPLN